jgi:hypothetical protein
MPTSSVRWQIEELEALGLITREIKNQIHSFRMAEELASIWALAFPSTT